MEIPEEYEGRDLGKLAELTLQTWLSSETAITLNPVENDKEGWDAFVEFPFLIPEEGKPWDTAASRLQCLIQVKGTDIGARKRNVKLDNWQKLIYSPLPAFFVIYEFDDGTLQQAYLVHVHEKWMERVLKRLRRSRVGDDKPLHKQFMTLTWSNDDVIHPASGKGLAAAIGKHVGRDFDGYVSSKLQMRQEVGLDAPFILHIKGREYSNRDEMFSELVDFALGNKEMPFTTSIEKDVRFGKASEIVEEHESLLTVSPPGHEVTLTFCNRSGTRKSVFPATVYSADYFFPGTQLPQKHKKYRIEYELGEWIYSPSDGSSGEPKTAQFQYLIDFSPTPRNIRELANSWRVILLLHEAKSKGMYLEMDTADQSNVRIGSVENAHVPAHFLLLAQTIDNAWFLVRYLDLPIGQINVTLEQIAKQAGPLRDVRILLRGGRPPFRTITGTLDLPLSDLEKYHVIVFGRSIELGDHQILITVGMGGPAKAWNDGVEFEIAPVMPLLTDWFILSEQLTVRKALASVYERLAEDGCVVLGAEPTLAQLEEEE